MVRVGDSVRVRVRLQSGQTCNYRAVGMSGTLHFFSLPPPPAPPPLWQVDVIGHNIRDLVHPQDFMEVAHIFSDQEPMVKPGG